jgi:hypothetical protein
MATAHITSSGLLTTMMMLHPLDLLRHRADNPGVGIHHVVAAHPRLAGNAGRDDEELGAGCLVVAGAADDAAVEALDRRALPLVEPFPLGHAVHHVHHDDGPGEILLGHALRGGSADISGADDGDLVEHVSNRVGETAAAARVAPPAATAKVPTG